MRKVRKSKWKILVVDAAMLFAAVQMTLCACGNRDTVDVEMETGQTSIAEETCLPEITAMTEITATPEVTDTPEPTQETNSMIGSFDWDEDESYMLCKIAMAEAEDQNTKGKALVILVVLNRVWGDNEFPDTIEEVIFQENQFSPVGNGRYDEVEPDADCYAALDLVMSGWDESKGALYFESESSSTWHRDNLKFLFQYGDHYFYTEREE